MEKELKILEESLKQKIQILQDLLQASCSQEWLLSKEEPDLEAYDQLVEKKDRMIDSIEHLDEGFELLYKRISEKIDIQRSQYSLQIRTLQEKITEIMDLSYQIQEQEKKNKKNMDEFFKNRRKVIRQGRQNSKVAMDYYRNMNLSGMDTSNFMDSKHYRE